MSEKLPNETPEQLPKHLIQNIGKVNFGKSVFVTVLFTLLNPFML